MATRMRIEGMTCEGCNQAVAEALTGAGAEKIRLFCFIRGSIHHVRPERDENEGDVREEVGHGRSGTE